MKRREQNAALDLALEALREDGVDAACAADIAQRTDGALTSLAVARLLKLRGHTYVGEDGKRWNRRWILKPATEG